MFSKKKLVFEGGLKLGRPGLWTHKNYWNKCFIKSWNLAGISEKTFGVFPVGIIGGLSKDIVGEFPGEIFGEFSDGVLVEISEEILGGIGLEG